MEPPRPLAQSRSRSSAGSTCASVRSATPSRIEGADRLLRLEVDLGGERRTVVAALARHYAPASLLRATVVVLANVEPAVIRGIRSEAMLLGAQCDTVPVLLTTARPVDPGAPIT